MFTRHLRLETLESRTLMDASLSAVVMYPLSCEDFIMQKDQNVSFPAPITQRVQSGEVLFYGPSNQSVPEKAIQENVSPVTSGNESGTPSVMTPDISTLRPYISTSAGGSFIGSSFPEIQSVRDQYGLTGSNQTVVIIDTGIAYTHISLGGGYGEGYQVVGGYDFAESDADPYDDSSSISGHGTHVAGILAGSGKYYQGVAPGVDLISLRIADDSGKARFAWLEKALRWVNENLNAYEHPITTVNISMGTKASYQDTPDWDTLEDEFNLLDAQGVFISVAAGNTKGQPDDGTLAYPATSDFVTAVGAVDYNGLPAFFSKRSQDVLLAPGRNIESTVPDYMGNGNGRDDDYSMMSGSSMASPYVAGCSVLLREALEYRGVTGINQEMLYDILYATSDMVRDTSTGTVYHKVNLKSAVDKIFTAELNDQALMELLD